MTAPRPYDPDALWRGLVAHRHVVPTAIPGTWGRGARFEEVHDRLNDLITRAGADENAEFLHFPPVIDRTILEKTDYLDAFPHLVGVVHSYAGKELGAKEMAQKIRDQQPWAHMLSVTEVVLAPAACYPVYPTFAGKLPEGGGTGSLGSWAFRHEPSPEPTRAQAFRVREYIRLGAPDEVLAWRDKWHARGAELLASLGLPATSDVAADPFFGRSGKMMAMSQVEQKLKFELGVPVLAADKLTAVCSFNYHQDKFGKIFGIQQPDGSVAHTACLGFGMERMVMALFQHHGLVVEEWPDAVRAQLWPPGTMP